MINQRSYFVRPDSNTLVTRKLILLIKFNMDRCLPLYDELAFHDSSIGNYLLNILDLNVVRFVLEMPKSKDDRNLLLGPNQHFSV